MLPTPQAHSTLESPCLRRRRAHRKRAERKRVQPGRARVAGPATNPLKARRNTSREAAARKRSRSSRRVRRPSGRSAASNWIDGRRITRTLARAHRSIWVHRAAESEPGEIGRDKKTSRRRLHAWRGVFRRAHPRGGLGSRFGCGSYVAFRRGSRKLWEPSLFAPSSECESRSYVDELQESGTHYR